MKKFLKIFFAIVGILLLLIVATIASLPLWLGPVVKPIANATVPQLTQTDFKLGHLSLNPYTGRFELGDMYLANPANYSEKCAAQLGMFVFDVDPASLASDVIHIEEVTISDVLVSVVYANKKMNYTQLYENITNSLQLAASSGETTVSTAATAGEGAAVEELNRKKVIIDKISLSGLKISFGLVTLPVPPLTIKDIGKSSGGATWAEVGTKVYEAVMKSSGAVGNAFGKAGAASLGLGKSALDTGAKGLDSAVESVKKLDFKGAEKTLKSTGDALKGLFK